MKTLAAGTGVVAVGAVLTAGAWSPVSAQRADDQPMDAVIAQAFGGTYLGVEIEEVTSADADELGLDEVYGARIVRVVEDGPAEEAGLEDGDVIRSWNGQRVEGVSQLQRLVRETPEGRRVRLGIVRDGDSRDITVEIGERSHGGNFRISSSPMRFHFDESSPRRALSFSRPGGSTVRLFMGTGRMGAVVQSLGEQLAEYFGVDGGALVTSVEEDSPAAQAGLRAGDVIVEFDGEEVTDPVELHRAAGDIEEGRVDLRVVRDGREQTLTIDLPERFGALDFGETRRLEAGQVLEWPAPRLWVSPAAPRLRTEIRGDLVPRLRMLAPRLRALAPRLRSNIVPLMRARMLGSVSI